MIRGPIASRRRGLLSVDVASLGVTGVAALVICDDMLTSGAIAGAALTVLVVFALAGAYRLAPDPFVRRGVAVRATVLAVLTVGFLAAHAQVGLREPWLSAGGSFAAGSLALVPFAAVAYLRLLASSWLERRVLLIGAGSVARQIAAGIQQHRALGLRVAGYLDDRPPRSYESTALQPYLGPVEHLEKVLGEFAIERVIVTLGEPPAASVEEALVAARLSGVTVESGVDCFEWLHERLPLEAPARQLFLEGPGYEASPLYGAAKRASDVILALVGLVLTAPLLALAAFAIKAESEGPVLFQQTRVGRNGRLFRMWKLRSMQVGAEKDGHTLADVDDPRVTRVGRVLRRARIDELPQLLNVLHGDMSIVGPRPERPEYYDELAGHYSMFRYRLAVRPGLTGWAQVQQGYVNDLEGFGIKLTYDLFYLRRRCLAVDAKVMWRTLRELVQLKGV